MLFFPVVLALEVWSWMCLLGRKIQLAFAEGIQHDDPPINRSDAGDALLATPRGDAGDTRDRVESQTALLPNDWELVDPLVRV